MRISEEEKKKITLSVIPRGEIKGHRRVHMFVPDERNRTFFFLESASISPVQRTGYELRHRVRHNYPDRADRFPKNQKKSQESRVQSSPSCTVIASSCVSNLEGLLRITGKSPLCYSSFSSPVKYTALSLQRHTYEQSYNGKRGKSCSIFTRTSGTTPLIHH